ncbi:MAG: hypothetical protein PHN88_13765 [Ignavibacteria bacterium]|nr:hypothetical protein [Ignavibacteria bacterium]
MKILRLLSFVSAFAVTLIICSCESSVTNNPIPEDINFTISVWDYSDYHYFFDTLYKRSYREYIDDSISGGFLYTQYVSEHRINTSPGSLEVWIQCEPTCPTKRLCAGTIMLDSMPTGGYDTSVTNPNSIQGLKYFGYFRKLQEDEYYCNEYAGFIGLRINVQNLHVGVAYKTLNGGVNFGRGSNVSLPTDTLILKLIKTDVESPIVAPLAWELKMKNVYRLPVDRLSSDTKIYVKYCNNYTPTPSFYNYLPGYATPLITMLKLDRYTTGTISPPPDGLFDWRPGFTVYPLTGDVFFPSLKPFSDGLKKAGINDSTYQFSEIYTQTKVSTQTSPKAAMYFLRGKTIQLK